MTTPPWADSRFSNDLPELRARGESQDLEFIVAFPTQVHELAKEIAAFATSNTGTIILGVADNGDLIGLENVESVESRDGLFRRVEGICTGPIKPAVTPKILWAVESGRAVLVIVVPKGSEPVYYSNQKPYLRHITTSRPAEPHEVIKLVKQYLESRIEGEDPEETEEVSFYANLARVLNRIFIWVNTPSEERYLNPWLEEWRTDYGYAATELRDLAAQDIAVRSETDEQIRELANALDAVAGFSLYIGAGNELEELASTASELAKELKQKTIDTLPLSENSIKQIRNRIGILARKTKDLGNRANNLIESGKEQEVQVEAGEIGNELSQLSLYNLHTLGDETSSELWQIGLYLRRIATFRIYADGGMSLKKIVMAVQECEKTLSALSEKLDREVSGTPVFSVVGDENFNSKEHP